MIADDVDEAVLLLGRVAMMTNTPGETIELYRAILIYYRFSCADDRQSRRP